MEKKTRDTPRWHTLSVFDPWASILCRYHTAVLEITASNVIADPSVSKDTCTLETPGFRHVAVKEYSEWLTPTVSDNTLKVAFR
jgi:hypothetical protein